MTKWIKWTLLLPRGRQGIWNVFQHRTISGDSERAPVLKETWKRTSWQCRVRQMNKEWGRACDSSRSGQGQRTVFSRNRMTSTVRILKKVEKLNKKVSLSEIQYVNIWLLAYFSRCWSIRKIRNVHPFPGLELLLPDPAAAAAKSFQLCPTLCDPIDGSPLGSSVPGIIQARILEWVAISFSSPQISDTSHQVLQHPVWGTVHTNHSHRTMLIWMWLFACSRFIFFKPLL